MGELRKHPRRSLRAGAIFILMAFIRKRGSSHQIIETYRDGGKVRQRVLANLGSAQTIDDRLIDLPKAAAETKRLLRKHERCIAAWISPSLKQRPRAADTQSL